MILTGGKQRAEVTTPSKRRPALGRDRLLKVKFTSLKTVRSIRVSLRTAPLRRSSTLVPP